MNISIIKYNAGNIQSVLFALERIGITANVTHDPELLRSSDKVIFPGVGEASTAMQYLKERNLDKLIISLKQPVLGICLGMQLLCNYSEENNTTCMGVFKTQVKKFTGALKTPQIGWNNIAAKANPLFNEITNTPYCYFVHSYYADLCNDTIAQTEYGITFSSALAKDNFFGVQFHPEKSAATGEQILKNFLSL
jgi:glutamine amidotransferase